MENITKFEIISINQYKKDLEKQNRSNYETYNNIKLPHRATKGSAGYDFYAPFDIILKPNETIIIPTGIRCKMNNNLVLMIFPRSSLGFKYRLNLDNTVGIIDSDYYYALNEGHIMIKVTNNSLDNKELNLKCGDAFAQGIFLNYGITCDDQTTESRTGGFGSTNK